MVDKNIKISIGKDDKTMKTVSYQEDSSVFDHSQNNECDEVPPGPGINFVRKMFSQGLVVQKKNSVTFQNLPKRPSIEIAFSDVTYSISEGCRRELKTILKGVNGKFRPGELTAIMGPSGAGKSTFMNILAGYKTSNISGTITINGNRRILRKFQKLSCYIMQDDRLMPYLTVKEAMMVSVNLKLGSDIKMSRKKIVIKEILIALGLSESLNTKTLNLSGGQRKRLSIALELVNNPPVMFFDEPTSGLDSSSCFQLITLMKSLAKGRRTIVCTIHQPSAKLFEMFDHLYMLAEGQCMYHGPVAGLVPFLGSLGYACPSYHNPADYVMEVASGDYGDAVDILIMAVSSGKCANFINLKTDDSKQLSQSGTTASNIKIILNDLSETDRSTSKSEASTTPIILLHEHNDNRNSTDEDQNSLKTTTIDTIVNIPTKDSSIVTARTSLCSISFVASTDSVAKIRKDGFATSGFHQFWILLKRAFLMIMRDKILTQMRLLSHVIVGGIIGMIYYDIGNDASGVTSNAGCIFFATLFTMFTAMMPTILTFPMEMAVFTREHLNYWYSLTAFYFAKTLADVPFQILFSSVYVVIVYYLTAQPFETLRSSMFVVMFILTSLVAQSFGLLIGAGFNVESGVFLGPVSTIPTVLFSGFFVNFEMIPKYLKWLTYVSYIRYSFEGAILSVYGMDRNELNCTEKLKIDCRFQDPKKFLEELSMDQSTYWHDVVALVVIFILLRVVAYFVLHLKIRSIR